MGRGRPKRENAAAENGDAPAAKLARAGTKFELSLPLLPRRSGVVLSCGQGEVGQLGLGEDVMEKTRPALIGVLRDIVDISAGGMHNLCLTRTGEVYSFGCNDEGALGRATADEEGSEFEPRKIELPAPCLKITAGDSHSACLLNDGRVYAWGSFRDSHGNMGLTLEGNKRLPVEVLPGVRSVDIASGGDHLVILTEHGHVYTVGCAEQGQLGRISTRAASGESRRGKTALLQPGVVIFKGKKLLADAVWASTYCTFCRDRNTAKIYAFGLNNYCQLGLPNPGENIVKPCFVPELTPFSDVRAIAGGQHHTMVLKESDSQVYVIGRKEYGRLGLGEVTEDAQTLQHVKTLAGQRIVQVACGESTSFAVTDAGDAYGWGMGSNQQLGTGSEEDEIQPVKIVSKQLQGKKVLKVSSGGQHSLFLVEETPVASSATQPTKETATSSTPKEETSEAMETDQQEEVCDSTAEDRSKKTNGITTTAKQEEQHKQNEDSDKNAVAVSRGRKRKA